MLFCRRSTEAPSSVSKAQFGCSGGGEGARHAAGAPQRVERRAVEGLVEPRGPLAVGVAARQHVEAVRVGHARKAPALDQQRIASGLRQRAFGHVGAEEAAENLVAGRRDQAPLHVGVGGGQEVEGHAVAGGRVETPGLGGIAGIDAARDHAAGSERRGLREVDQAPCESAGGIPGASMVNV
ncbi:hypothetical protein [Ramlibacter montanisoli]|uniref:Uncharacterized protein n=1 Tax=Ramlibacter montanisoli TaxID=2732512 RepID=A0A849K8B9_9BURK|nr:hypothetical protein [Ramlibacter montanisoli]NNU43750.1 hypothetical protein [Ramlibacter montanisoli]